MKPKKFRKKPVIVECMRFAGDVSIFSGWCSIREKAEDGSGFTISTPEGEIKCLPGDWIIKDTNGEFHLCKSDLFIKIYEELPEN